MVTNKSTGAPSANTPKRLVKKPNYNDTAKTKQLFLMSALSMSWQMVIAVLIPVLGGYYLDQYFKTSPWLTLVGFVLAVVLVVLIVRRTINNLPGGFNGDDE